MRLAEQINFHFRRVGVNTKIAIAKLPENRSWAQVPTRPRERRVSIHVLGVSGCPGVKEELDGSFGAESRGTVERSLAPGAAVAHEAARDSGWLGHRVGIRTVREQDSNHCRIGREIGFAERRVQGRFSGIRQGIVDVRALLNQELTESPVPVEAGAIEIEIGSERAK